MGIRICLISFNKWTKISSHDIIIFELKNDGKKSSRIYFEIHRAPSEIPAELPGQFGHSRQIFLHWAAATPKGLGEFQNKKSRPLFTIIFQDSRFQSTYKRSSS